MRVLVTIYNCGVSLKLRVYSVLLKSGEGRLMANVINDLGMTGLEQSIAESAV